MSALGSLNIQLSLDAIQFQQGLTKAQYEAKRFADRTKSEISQAEQCFKRLHNQIDMLGSIGKLVGLGGLATQFTSIADAGTELSNKLKLVTDDELQHARAMADVYDISMKTAQSTQAVSSVYQSFAQNAKELGINQRQVADVTEIISKAVAISGASASEAQNALTQFSQTLLMGKMRAQEYNSIMTQTPAVMQAIARGLGVTMGELKAMSDEGKLTTDKMIKALEKSKASVDELYGKTATTVSGAMQNLQTATQKWVGEVDSSLGITDKAVKATQLLSENLDELAKIALTVGVAYGSWKFGSVIQGQYNSIKATQAETTAKYEKLAALTQETQATYQTQLATYQSIQAKQADVVATQTQVQAEQAKLRVLALSASSYAERRIIQTQLQALDRVSAELTQKQTLLDQQQAIAKQALNKAYHENAAAQSAFAVSTKASGVAMTAFSTITAGVKAEMNALKVAMMSNPIMMGLTVLTTVSSMLYIFANSTNEATEASLRYADSIDQVKANLEQMTAVQTAAELIKVKQSIEAQEEALAKLRHEQERLANEAKTTKEVIYDAYGGSYEIVKTAKELSKANDDLALKTAEVETAQNKLNKTLEWQRDLKAYETVAEIRDRFAELFPNIEQSQINTDGLNVSLGGFISNIPVASVEALRFAGAVGQIATSAVNAAVAVANLAGIQVGNEKLNLHIANNQALIDINKAQASGNTKLANELRAQFNAKNKAESLGVQQGTKEWEDLVNSELALLNSTPKGGGGRGGSPKPKAEKSREDYLEQVTDMTLRLAGLKDDALNLAQDGELSQYQELSKLTEDIARNTEKYSQYGIEGVAKLKELAAQIDSENQKIAIAQFSFDNKEKLREMEFELTLLGKTRQEQEALQYAHQLDLEASRLKIGMTKENAAALEQEIIKLKERHAEIQRQTEAARQNPVIGLRAGLADFAEEATNVSGQIQNIVTGSLNSMTDALNTFVMTGKADFRSLATSILSDINKMIIKMMIFKAIQSAGSAMGFDMSFMGNVGFATGGYTGDGGKYTPAGIVHKGEYVITKEATSRLGLDYLNYLNYGKRGFATGGGVAVPRVPNSYKPAQTGGANNQVSISINIDQNGNAESDVSQTAQQSKQLAKMIEAKVLDVLVQQKRSGNLLA